MNTKGPWIQNLVRQLEGRLLRYTCKFTNLEVGREIVQEAFLRLWQEEPQKLSGRETEWLFCVCRNLSLDHLKKEKRLDPIDNDFKSTQDLESQVEQKQTNSKVIGCIDKLPVPQQEVIRLKFQEGLSYEQISKVTGHSTSYVGVLIHSAMTELRKNLRGGLQ